MKPVPVDLKKLSDFVVVNKYVYNELVKRVNAIDTNKLVIKTGYNTKIKDIEDKIPSVTNLATTTATTLSAAEKRYPTLVM